MDSEIVLVCGTGGTIAGQRRRRGQKYAIAGYDPGVRSIEALVNQLDAIDLPRIQCVQLCNKASSDISPDDLVQFARILQDEVRLKICKFVVTFGTDCLAADATALGAMLSAYLELITIVFVAAVLPNDALGADGPRNLHAAIMVANHPDAKGRGVLVLMGNYIYSACYATKSDPNKMDAFDGGPAGSVGVIRDGEVIFFYPATQPNGSIPIDLNRIGSQLPDVQIIHGQQGDYGKSFTAAVSSGAKGIILATMAGSWTSAGGRVIEDYMRANPSFPVVATSGFTGPNTELYGLPDNMIRSVGFDANKTCILLQLLMGAQMSRRDIYSAFQWKNTASQRNRVSQKGFGPGKPRRSPRFRVGKCYKGQ